tara:strand:- start:856 stop:1239 length:384 start_codon:yes stop_codon:yes gene_type:complete
MNILKRSKLFSSYSKVYILSNRFIHNEIELSEKVFQFKQSLIDRVSKLIPNSVVLKSKEIASLLSYNRCIDVIYPGVGHNLDLINKYVLQYQFKVNYIYREEDLLYWNYAKAGFYKFKTSFYKLNNI